MIRQAIIPLAGLGTRLLPLTSVIPKELLPINGKPGIEYIIEECISSGVKEIIFVISKNKAIHAYGPLKKVVIMPIKKTISIIYKTANLKVIGIRRIIQRPIY